MFNLPHYNALVQDLSNGTFGFPEEPRGIFRGPRAEAFA